MDSLKKLLPLAVVGVLSGATTFGAIKYFDTSGGNNGDFSYFHEAKNNAQFAGNRRSQWRRLRKGCQSYSSRSSEH